MNKQMLIYSPYATKAIAEGRTHGMRFRAVNRREVPPEPFYEDGFWHETLKSEYTIRSDLQERLDIISKVVPIKELVIAHEAPKLLTAPIEEKAPQNSKTDTYQDFDATPIVAAIVGVLGACLAIVGIIFIAAIRIDPVLIAVLPDGTWLEVATWYD